MRCVTGIQAGPWHDALRHPRRRARRVRPPRPLRRARRRVDRHRRLLRVLAQRFGPGRRQRAGHRPLARRPPGRPRPGEATTKIGGEPAGPDSWRGWPANREGLGAPAVRAAVEGSRRRLGIDTIDLLWLHQEDRSVPIEQTVDAIAEQGARVGRVGASNHPAWRVERGRRHAIISGVTPIDAGVARGELPPGSPGCPAGGQRPSLRSAQRRAARPRGRGRAGGLGLHTAAARRARPPRPSDPGRLRPSGHRGPAGGTDRGRPRARPRTRSGGARLAGRRRPADPPDRRGEHGGAARSGPGRARADPATRGAGQARRRAEVADR
jgi:hypothetical protein